MNAPEGVSLKLQRSCLSWFMILFRFSGVFMMCFTLGVGTLLVSVTFGWGGIELSLRSWCFKFENLLLTLIKLAILFWESVKEELDLRCTFLLFYKRVAMNVNFARFGFHADRYRSVVVQLHFSLSRLIIGLNIACLVKK